MVSIPISESGMEYDVPWIVERLNSILSATKFLREDSLVNIVHLVFPLFNVKETVKQANVTLASQGQYQGHHILIGVNQA